MKINKLLLSLLLVSFSLTSYSRETSGKGERGLYRTNEKAFDNTFIGVAGGVNFNFGDYDNGKSSPALDIYFGKWWTPQAGARIGYSGIQLKGLAADSSKEKWNMNFIHADFLWNICNAVQGYRGDRVWNVMPFIGFGVMNCDSWLFGGNVGIYNTFKVAGRVLLTLEGRYSLTRDEFDGDRSQVGHKFDSFISLSAGIAFRLGKVGFDRHETFDCSSYENSIEAYRKALDDANIQLAAADAELKNLQERLAAAGDDKTFHSGKTVSLTNLELFFSSNSAELDTKELDILDEYIRTVGKDVTFTVTGTADKSTGSDSYNQDLSDRRAAYVARLLSERYGIRSVVSSGAGAVETHSNPVMNRTATIVLK